MSTEEKDAAQFQDDPRGWAQRLAVEFTAARKALKKWHDAGAKVVTRFLDDRETGELTDARWNLFTTNIETQMATLYGQAPRVSVARRNADSKDDVARVAGEMLERVLNADLESDGDTFAEDLQHALEDRLLPGCGQVRVRYVLEEGQAEQVPAKVAPDGVKELAPAYTKPPQTYECVETDYVHWKDWLWSPAKVWRDVRWVAFKAEMSRQQLVQRFGPEVGNGVPLNSDRNKAQTEEERTAAATPWGRADVWEVWVKEVGKVFWYVEGYPTVLDTKEDPLQLEGFFPCPKPMVSLATTTKLVPKPEFTIAQDLYDEVDRLSTRIRVLTDAVKVAGCYDQSAGEMSRILTAKENTLIPVQNWQGFAEKGGVAGVVQFMPLDQVALAINALSERRMVAKDALYEVTGMADIMRGAATAAGASATEQSIKAKFGSVRLQRKQDEFARFASDVQKLKAEIIARHFDAATIIEASNILQTPDAELAQQAVQLIQSRRSAYRVEVKPEAVALQDFAQLKAEGMEVLAALASYFQAAAPVAQSVPGSMPFLLEVMQWGLARVRGASSIEGVIDSAIAAAKTAAAQPQQPPQPDPKVQAQMLKGQQDIAKVDAELKADVVRAQVEVQADAQRESNQRQQNVLEAAQKHEIIAAGRALQPTPTTRPGSGGGL
jgi:hypothetical protein